MWQYIAIIATFSSYYIILQYACVIITLLGAVGGHRGARLFTGGRGPLAPFRTAPALNRGYTCEIQHLNNFKIISATLNMSGKY